jgi:hypothetical protein
MMSYGEMERLSRKKIKINPLARLGADSQLKRKSH